MILRGYFDRYVYMHIISAILLKYELSAMMLCHTIFRCHYDERC